MESVIDTQAVEVVQVNDIFKKVDMENNLLDSTEAFPIEDINEDVEMLTLDNVELSSTETITTVVYETKSFEQSGYEIAVVLCLAIIIGLIVFDMLSKRWFT